MKMQLTLSISVTPCIFNSIISVTLDLHHANSTLSLVKQEQSLHCYTGVTLILPNTNLFIGNSKMLLSIEFVCHYILVFCVVQPYTSFANVIY